MLDCHRLRNRASHGRADDMHLLEAEHVQQSHRVGSHIREQVRSSAVSVTGKRARVAMDWNILKNAEPSSLFEALLGVLHG
jgi:hypothetical protein